MSLLKNVDANKTSELAKCDEEYFCEPDEYDPCQGHCECDKTECKCKVGPPVTTPGPHDQKHSAANLFTSGAWREAAQSDGFRKAAWPRNPFAKYEFLSNRRDVTVEVGSQRTNYNKFTVLSRDLVCPKVPSFWLPCEDPQDPWIWNVRCPMLFSDMTDKFLPSKWSYGMYFNEHASPCSMTSLCFCLFYPQSHPYACKPCACLSALPVWMLLARQRDGVSFFANEWRTESINEQGDKYAILDEMDSCRGEDGNYTFKLSWPLSKDIADIVWVQSNNPVKDSQGGVKGFRCHCDECACPANFAGLEYNNKWALLQSPVQEESGNNTWPHRNRSNDTWLYRVGTFGDGQIRGPKGYRPNDVMELRVMCVSPAEGERALPKDESDVQVPKSFAYQSAAQAFKASADNTDSDNLPKKVPLQISDRELCTNGKWANGLFALYRHETFESNITNATNSSNSDIIPDSSSSSDNGGALDVDDEDEDVGWDPESCHRVLTKNKACSKDWFGIARNGHCYCVDAGDPCRDRTPAAQLFGLYLMVEANSSYEVKADGMDTNDTVIVTEDFNITRTNKTNATSLNNTKKANNSTTGNNGTNTSSTATSILSRFVRKLSEVLHTRRQHFRGKAKSIFGTPNSTESESAETARLRLKVMLDDLKHGRIPSVPLASADENSPPGAMGAESDVCRVQWQNNTALDAILITKGCGCQELLERARETGVVSLTDISIPCQNSLEAFAWDQVVMRR